MKETLIPRSFPRAGSVEALTKPRHDVRQFDSGYSDEIMRQVLRRSLKDQIRDRAYELYVQRGRREGHQLRDWLDAELEMLANR